MRKIKYIIISLMFITLITGCNSKEKSPLKVAHNNTSISEEKVNSYRVKISVRSNDIEENYIVYNDSNKKYEILFIDNEEMESATIEDGKTTIYDKEYNEVSTELKYDYTDTDLFLIGLDKVGSVEYKEEIIGEETYKIYDFNVSNETMNKILKPFNLNVKDSGTCKTYINSKEQVYLVIYNFGDISVSASYTMIK